jgi:NTE family protein
MDTTWTFLCELRDAGRVLAASWLDQHFDQIGKQSTVDLRAEFM